MNNIHMKIKIKKSGFTQRQIAEEMGIHEASLSRSLNNVLTAEKKAGIEKAILRLKDKHTV